MKVEMSQSVEAYFSEIERRVEEAYEIARRARLQGKDPELEPEIPQAEDMASRVEEMVGPPGVSRVIRELEGKMSREELALKVAEMIVDGVVGEEPSDEKRAEQAVRTALAIITEGIAVAAPLEGLTEVRIERNPDGSRYLALYFSGPIRSAGGTAAALAVLAGDFVRRKLLLDRYKPTKSEVERFVEEVNLYSSEISHLQYTPSPDEVRLAVRNLPVEITGEPTHREVMVTAYRDLPRVGHNFVRGGAVLALAEGVLQKAPKIMKYVRKLGMEGWDWLEELMQHPASEKEEVEEARYLEEVIGGRPVISYPGRPGGFRLRYGRARNTGIAAVGVHPATMVVLGGFLAVGTQLKLERPGKGGAVAPVDTIEGPTVKLQDGSVVRVSSVEEAERLKGQIEEILCLGDLLVDFGEFLENNHPLLPAGYCEEWWAQEVERAGKGFPQDLSPYLFPPYPVPPPGLAVEISEKLGVPLHPWYTYLYHEVEREDLLRLARWLCRGEAEFEGEELKGLTLPLEREPKRILELLCVPHRVEGDRVRIEEHALPLCRTLGILKGRERTTERLEAEDERDVMLLLEKVAGFPVRRKAPTWIGSKMGRPEKAKPREMDPPPHLLFPVGQAGGPTRSLLKAASSREELRVELANLKCPSCGTLGITRKCPSCGEKTEFVKLCPKCGRPARGRCQTCGAREEFFSERLVNLKEMLEEAEKRLGEKAPADLKGVRGMSSAYKVPEPLEKGILRAKHGLRVFKDGTVRFDATNLPLTHFRPKEVGVSVERLRELGYTRDYLGEPLEREDQLVELKVQDLLLCEEGAKYLLGVSKFLDELLQKFYGLPPYYRAQRKEDLLGHLVLGLSPHTSVGMVGRIVGFTKANVGYAHPYFHAAKRRDCDGDEDAVMLLLDALLNFSRKFLPASRGGFMDAPLVLNLRIDPREVDKEVHNMDVMFRYPLEFYEATLKQVHPSEVLARMETVEKRLGTRGQYEGLAFNVHTSDLSSGPLVSIYSTLETMEEKVMAQLNLARKIRAVDERDVAERVIEHHLIPDLKGNLRKFSTQQFRCTSCNTKYRRLPLTGVCSECGGNLVLTVPRGGVEKYLRTAMRVAEEFGVREYTKQRLKLMESDIKSVFESDAEKQTSLADFL